MSATITDLLGFANMMGEDEARLLPRRLYKSTSCGASLSLHLADGTNVYGGSKALEALTLDAPVVAVSVSSIVEGSDVEVEPRRLDFPFTEAQWDEAVQAVEDEADFYWRRDNYDHFLVERPGVLHGDYVEGVEAGWGVVLFDGPDGVSGRGLTPAERLAVSQTVMAWDDPQPGTSRKVGDLTIQCYSQDTLTF